MIQENWQPQRFLPACPMRYKGYPVQVQKKKIKNFYLRCDPEQEIIRVSAPAWAGEVEVEKLLQEKSSWLDKRLQRMKRSAPFTVLGEETMVIYELKGRSSYDKGMLVVGIEEDTSLEKEMKKNLFLKELLKEQVLILLEEIKEEFGLEVSGFRIKDMKTRWGSINIKTSKMNLSLKLVHKKPWVIKAVILHELAHLKYPGHQKDFYSYLEELCPHYKEAKRELLST